MANLAKYVVQLEAQTAKYRRELDRANRRLGRFEKTQRRGLGRITRQFKMLAPAVSAVGLAFFARDAITSAAAIKRLTDRLGGTTEGFSELAFVAKQSGLEFRVMELGLQRMSRRTAEAASGFGEAKGALKELNLDARRLIELPIDKQFEIVAEQLSRVEAEADRTRLAMKLFDSEGVALLQTMTDGSEGIQKMRTRARELGVTLSADMAQKAVEAEQASGELAVAVKALGRDLTLVGAGPLTSFVEGLTSFIETARQANRDRLEGPDPVIEMFDKYKTAHEELSKLSKSLEALGDKAGEGFKANIFDKQREVAQLFLAHRDAVRQATAAHKEWVATNTAGGNIEPPAPTGLGGIDLGELEAFNRKWETVEQRVERNLDILQKYKAELSPEEFARIHASIKNELIEGLDEIEVTNKRITATARESWNKYSVYADEAARSSFNALSDFLFEPFEDGLEGMIKGFADAMRRMTANSLAAQLFGFFGFTGAIPGRAGGGSVSAGQPYEVGERGRELFVPSTSGTIIPNGAYGGGGPSYYIDARGADEQTIIHRIQPLLERTVEITRGLVHQDMKDGRL